MTKGRGLVVLRWTAAALVVVAAHGALVWLALHWQVAEAMPSEPAAMIELAPLAVAPEARPQDIAPGPQMTDAQPEPTLETVDKVDDAVTPTEPTIPTEQVPVDARTIPAPESDIKVSELPKVDRAEVGLTSPPRLREPKVLLKPKKRDVEPKGPINQDRSKTRQTTAPPTSNSRLANTAAAPSAGASLAGSASWKGELMAHLNRFKRFPPGATSSGTAAIAFTISRSGQVLSSRLVRSSGEGALDQEAVSLPRRASPVPAPPPSVGGAAITLSVPIRFNR